MYLSDRTAGWADGDPCHVAQNACSPSFIHAFMHSFTGGQIELFKHQGRKREMPSA